MKIQYPGVADSIESDLKNLHRLMELTNILPPGLFIEEIIKVSTSTPSSVDVYRYDLGSSLQIATADVSFNRRMAVHEPADVGDAAKHAE